MTKRQLETLAAKLWAAYMCAYCGIKALGGYYDLSTQVRAAWLAAAKTATRELTNNPRPLRRRAAKPKACKLDAHGKRECSL